MDTFICDVDEVQLSAGSGPGGIYAWTPNYNLSDTTISNPIAAPDVTTVYTVLVTDANGCTSSDSVTIMVTDTVIATTSGDQTICEGQQVQLLASNAVYYQWTPPTGLSDPFSSDPVATPLTSVTYYVSSFIGSCYDEDTITITVLPVPIVDAGEDVTINQGESTELNVTGEGSYTWTPPDGLSDPTIANPLASPLNTTKYTVTVFADNGCSATDSVTVTVTHIHQIIVPNAFTPNGDGLNDQFLFYTKGIEKILSVKVFSRWGQVMYTSTGGEEGWDGTYSGAPCELGVYAYEIAGVTYDGDVLRENGALTLLR
jgi:gliding motility-associated-like protein